MKYSFLLKNLTRRESNAKIVYMDNGCWIGGHYFNFFTRLLMEGNTEAMSNKITIILEDIIDEEEGVGVESHMTVMIGEKEIDIEELTQKDITELSPSLAIAVEIDNITKAAVQKYVHAFMEKYYDEGMPI